MQPLRSIFIYHKNHPPFHSTATCLPNKHIEYTPITPSFYSFSDAFFLSCSIGFEIRWCQELKMFMMGDDDCDS